MRNVQRKYAKLEKEYEEIKEKWDELYQSAEDAEAVLDKVENSISESTSQSITILGIFSGIVMAFTGGLSFIASSLQNINAISKYRLVFIIILLALAIFDIIFMLIYVIGKITGSYVGSACNCDCEFDGCDNKKISCVAVRYPLATWVNVVCFILLFFTGMLSLIDKYDLLSYISNILNSNIDTNFLILIAISTMFLAGIIAIIYLIFKLRQIECKHTKQKSLLKKIKEYFRFKFKNIKQ